MKELLQIGFCASVVGVGALAVLPVAEEKGRKEKKQTAGWLLHEAHLLPGGQIGHRSSKLSVGEKPLARKLKELRLRKQKRSEKKNQTFFFLQSRKSSWLTSRSKTSESPSRKHTAAARTDSPERESEN